MVGLEISFIFGYLIIPFRGIVKPGRDKGTDKKGGHYNSEPNNGSKEVRSDNL